MNIVKHILTAFLCICIFNSCNTDESEGVLQVAAIPVVSLNPDGVHAFTADTSFGIAGDVYMDKEVEGHIRISEGKGILFNQPGSDTNTYASTNEHGDLNMHVEFMVSKGSSAALYFQGRYGIQLADSRSKGSSFLHCGAILQNGRTKTGPMMTLPVSDAGRVPGLWQRLDVEFSAPRFDSSGHKLSDAVFKEVLLNGQLIHKNTAVTNTAPDTVFKQEKSTGPLTVRSHHGAMAFRNLNYAAQSQSAIALSDMQYDVYKELSVHYDTLTNFTATRTGSTDSLTWRLGDRKKQLVIAGTMNVAEEGDYIFKVKAGGPAYLLIDSSNVVDNHQSKDYAGTYFGNRYLQKGMHGFKLVYANHNDGLVLEYQGPVTPFTALTTPASARKPEEGISKYVGNKPIFRKGLFRHLKKVNTNIISVGIPGGLNYAYDQSTGNLLSAWRGKYLVPDKQKDSAAPAMQVPSGAPVEFRNVPAVFSLTKPDGFWPDTLQVNDSIYTNREYRFDTTGLPVFLYRHRNMSIEDYIYPGKDNNGLIRQITMQSDSAAEPVYFMIGSGSFIERLPNGLYAIDDKTYYVQILNAGDEKNVSIVKDDAGRYRLLLLLSALGSDALFSYSIIW